MSMIDWSNMTVVKVTDSNRFIVNHLIITGISGWGIYSL